MLELRQMESYKGIGVRRHQRRCGK